MKNQKQQMEFAISHLDNSLNKKLLLIINPVSGVKKIGKYLLKIIDMFSCAGYECLVQTTSLEVTAEKIAEKYSKECDLVVCVGGDGTFNETVAGCLKVKTKPKIGYIPTGSTNDFANSLAISLNPIDATSNILKNRFIDIDICVFNGRIFTYIASFGIFTKTSYSTPKELKNSLGYFAYLLEGVKEISDIKSYHIKIESDNKTLEGDYVFGGICNSKRIAGGIIHFSDDAVDMNDGLFEVFLIKYPRNASEFMQLVFDFNSGNYNSSMIELFSTKNLRIIMEDGVDWTIDGEYQHGVSEILAENKMGAISLVL